MQKGCFGTGFVALWLCLALVSGSAVAAGAPEKAQKVVVHLSHYTDDLHAAAMALKLGAAMLRNGAEVTLMLDLEGVRLADPRQTQDLRWGGETPIGQYYDAFLKAGGKVVLCPHCAHAAGIVAGSLRPGAAIAQEDALAQAILEASTVLDY